jgi:hypothetical protein
VPQTWVDSVVCEAIRQAAGNVGGVKLAGNIGVEPHAAATVRKSLVLLFEELLLLLII